MSRGGTDRQARTSRWFRVLWPTLLVALLTTTTLAQERTIAFFDQHLR